MGNMPRTGLPRSLKPFYDWLSAGAGAGIASATMSVAEEGLGPFKKTVITFTNHPIALTDEAGVVAYGSQKVYDFPIGYIRILGAVLDLALTKSSAGVSDTWDGDIGVGSTAAGNNNALATTEQNIIPTTPTPQAVAGATTGDAQSTATENAAILDGHTTAVDAYVNILVDDADHDVGATPANIILNGSLTILWVSMGDN